MAHRPIGELQPPTVEKSVLADEHGVGSFASKRREGGVNLATRTGVEDLELQPHGAAGRLHLAQGALRVGSIGGIDEYGHTRGRRQHFAQQLEPLCRQFETQQIDSGQIAARARQTVNETKLDRVFGDREYDAPLAASTVVKPAAVAMTATCRRTRSAASSGRRSICSAQR